jgi:phage repressor protein C with HTH and peptisase S24 domain
MRNDWLKYFISDRKNLSVGGLAKAISQPSSRVSEIIAGKRKVGPHEIEPMAQYLKLPDVVLRSYLKGSGGYPRSELSERIGSAVSSAGGVTKVAALLGKSVETIEKYIWNVQPIDDEFIKELSSISEYTFAEIKLGGSVSSEAKLLHREFVKDNLIKLAKIEINKLDSEASNSESNANVFSKQLSNSVPDIPRGAVPITLPADENIPVRGLAAAGNGLYHFDAEPIEYVATPDSLRGVKGAFAMYVRGDSMEDVLFEGSLIYIHPYQPPRVNDLVVVERTDGGVLIKRLVRRTDRAVTLREYSPKRREFDTDRSEIRHLYRVAFVAL